MVVPTSYKRCSYKRCNLTQFRPSYWTTITKADVGTSFGSSLKQSHLVISVSIGIINIRLKCHAHNQRRQTQPWRKISRRWTEKQVSVKRTSGRTWSCGGRGGCRRWPAWPGPPGCAGRRSAPQHDPASSPPSGRWARGPSGSTPPRTAHPEHQRKELHQWISLNQKNWLGKMEPAGIDCDFFNLLDLFQSSLQKHQHHHHPTQTYRDLREVWPGLLH